MSRYNKIVKLFFAMMASWLLIGVGHTVKNYVSHDIGAVIIIGFFISLIVCAISMGYLIIKEMIK